MQPDRENIRFNVLRNALYHTSRRRFFERANRFFTFLVIVLGTAAAADFATKAGYASWITGLAVAVVGTLQLVFDFSRAARDHQVLQRDYYVLLADIEGQPEADQAQCARWYAGIIRITADEPPVLRAVDAKAYNDALDTSVGFDAGERLVIPWTHRIFGWLLPFEGHNYRKMTELPSAKG